MSTSPDNPIDTGLSSPNEFYSEVADGTFDVTTESGQQSRNADGTYTWSVGDGRSFEIESDNSFVNENADGSSTVRDAEGNFTVTTAEGIVIALDREGGVTIDGEPFEPPEGETGPVVLSDGVRLFDGDTLSISHSETGSNEHLSAGGAYTLSSPRDPALYQLANGTGEVDLVEVDGSGFAHESGITRGNSGYRREPDSTSVWGTANGEFGQTDSNGYSSYVDADGVPQPGSYVPFAGLLDGFRSLDTVEEDLDGGLIEDRPPYYEGTSFYEGTSPYLESFDGITRL